MLGGLPDWLAVVALTLGAGLTMPLGAALGRWQSLRPNWMETEFRHGVIAFGGGALLAAVALVLVPEGVRHLSPLAACAVLLAGALSFMALDVMLARKGTPASQLVAMLADYLPEALALGATLASDGKAAPLLALIIAMQNLPEGFNAYRELAEHTGKPPKKLVASFALVALLGPVLGLAGFFLFAQATVLVGAIMLFAAGGILYLLFQDIAPQVRLDNHWGPPLGAVLGFMLGLAGQMLIGA
ncbi:ZIP family metal transporter [Roseibaca sp. Y0-43]|uniref:ZIP family metal transporter n=1 Tax=Roseibaca sp. Y0-43 TaxID=2816854 RepID=UPI001D0CAEAE|nr:hypothetical protein [Roseibaca sp. Y0-43]MCC1480546.1 hypothetical protein [Roseibaca sp. Y0-43]